MGILVRHRQVCRFGALLGLTLLACTAFAEIDLRNATVERLDNGMTVILLVDRNFPVVSVQMLYRVGARNESYGQTGIAHFVEHMAFRDSKNFPDTGVVSSIYARGGEWHGYTWTDETTYFATVPQEHVELLLRIEADRMNRLEISQDDMQAERGAVLAEMHSYENYPTSMLLDAVMYTSFLAHPYRNNTIGWESDIKNISHADVVAFYERYYQPANAVLAVVGDFDRGATSTRIRELFGGFESEAATPLPHTVEPVQQGERRVRLYGNSEIKRFMIAWRAPSANSPDYAAFLVLQEVLGASSGINFSQNDWGAPVGETSLLYGAADNMTTWYPPSAQDYTFVIGGTVDEDASEAAVESEIASRLRKLRRHAPDRKLVAASIDKVLDQLEFDVATTEDAAHQLAFFGGLHALDKLLHLPELVRQVGAADVQRVAQTWLKPKRRTIGWYVPGESAERTRVAAAVPDIEKEVTSNPPAPVDTRPVPPPATSKLSGGIPVIVQESDMSPTVHLQVVLRGNDILGEGIEANDPVRGYSSLSGRFRPDELQSRIAEARGVVDAATIEPEFGDTLSDDPATRLEQAFADVMTAEKQGLPDSVAVSLIVISGDVSREESLAALEKHFGDLQAGAEATRPAAGFEPEDIVINLGHPVAQAQLGYIVPAPGPEQDRHYAHRLLLYILSHDYEGRLGKKAISNRGLAYYIGSRYRSDGVNGWITLSVGVDPEKLAPMKSLIAAELERLRDQPPTVAEFEEAKAHLIGREKSSAQSNEELSTALAKEFLWYGETRTSAELAKSFSTISRSQVLDIVPDFIDGTTIVVGE